MCINRCVYTVTSLRGTFPYSEVQAFFFRNMNFGKPPNFFVLVVFSLAHRSCHVALLTLWLILKGDKILAFASDRDWPAEQCRVGSTCYKQLYRMHLHSAFSHHLGQLHSTSHVGLMHCLCIPSGDQKTRTSEFSWLEELLSRCAPI